MLGSVGMEGQLAELLEQNKTLTGQLASMLSTLEAVQAENKLLHQKVQLLLKRIYGKKTEKFDPGQLELLLELGVLPSEPEPDNDPPPNPPKRRGPRKRKERLPEDLPTEDVIIDPDEVRESPQDYQCIGEEVSEELDVIPQQYIRRRFVRRKYKSKKDRSRPPIIAPLPGRVIPGSYASAGLITDIILKKYADHLPLYRQESIMKSRYGIELSRKTMCDWMYVAAEWLKPICREIREELRKTGYLQIDESPVRYLRAEGGGSRKGYLWVYSNPKTDVLYEWHTGRGSDCLKTTLDGFEGTIQTDGYKAYPSYAKDKPGIEIACCWAHARRKFHEALESGGKVAGWFLNQIGHLYRIEREMREARTPATLRAVRRASESAMVLARLETALKLKMASYLPNDPMLKAIAYTLSLWKQLQVYRDNGAVEIDNNLVENAIRPTAIGKKNWMFFGDPKGGERSAVLYTILETCKRHGIDQRQYLRDVLTRLPNMMASEVGQLLPKNWLEAKKAAHSAA